MADKIKFLKPVDFNNQTVENITLTQSQISGLIESLQNIREVAEGKNKVYVLSYNTNEPQESYFYDTNWFKLDDTQLTTYADFINYIHPSQDEYSIGNGAFNSQESDVSIHFNYLIFESNKGMIVATFTDIASYFKTGDIIIVKELNVPDRWYNGSFSFSKLETQKVDLGWSQIGTATDPKPTTIEGYGITDALSKTEASNTYQVKGNYITRTTDTEGNTRVDITTSNKKEVSINVANANDQAVEINTEGQIKYTSTQSHTIQLPAKDGTLVVESDLYSKADIVNGVVPDYELPDYADILYYNKEQACTKATDFEKIIDGMEIGEVWWCTSNREPDLQSDDADLRAGSIYGQTFFKKIAEDPGYETIQPKTNALYIYVLSSSANRAKRWNGTGLVTAFGSVINQARDNTSASATSVGTAYAATYGKQNYQDIVTLQGSVSGLQSDFAGLASNVSTMGEALVTAQNDISGLQSDYSTVKEALETDESDIGTLKTDVSTIQGYIPVDTSNSNPLVNESQVDDKISAVVSCIRPGTGTNSTVQGTDTQALKENSHAEGYLSIADGEAAHAEGYHTSAGEKWAHAEGNYTQATNYASHAEGICTKAIGEFSHAEGFYTEAHERATHSEGLNSVVYAPGMHVEGYKNKVGTSYVLPEGKEIKEYAAGTTYTKDDYVRAPGAILKALDNFTQSNYESLPWDLDDSGNWEIISAGGHAEGADNISSGLYSHTEGNECIAEGSYSHAEGWGSQAKAEASHAENDSRAEGSYSHAEGRAIAEGSHSHAEGSGNTKAGSSHAEGSNTMAAGYASHAEGFGSQREIDANRIKTVSGDVFELTINDIGTGITALHLIPGMILKHICNNVTYYHVVTELDWSKTDYTSALIAPSDTTDDKNNWFILFGTSNENASHSEGYYTSASGDGAHAEGYMTAAVDRGSHAEGRYTSAFGFYSHAEGAYTVANHRAQHVFGELNILDDSASVSTSRGNYVEIVGNGNTSTVTRSNARTLDWSGNEWLAGWIEAQTVRSRSDERLKENIVSFAPEKSILELDVKKFDFKDGKKNNIGCIAQDLQKICPELVSENSDGYLTIEESKLVYLLLDEIKKLNKRITDLENK